MLTKRYLASTKNVPAIFQQIVNGTAPEKFTVDHLKNLGFASSNDRAIIPLLKDLGFLTAEGSPTSRYHNYRNKAISKKVMGEALKEAYQPIFHINEKPTKSDRDAVLGLFKSTHNVTDKVAECMSMTFYSLLDLAEISSANTLKQPVEHDTKKDEQKEKPAMNGNGSFIPPQEGLNLRYNIEIHLPATKDIEVYNAIFKSLKQHLIDG